MNSSKSFRSTIVKAKQMSTRPTNHYETLEISQNSTQDDIKSAYYKLSKKYHPDINNTTEAKTKFQNVSDAYEILGNFQKRKLYDRDLLTRGGYTATGTVRSSVYQTPPDPLSEFYKSRTVNQNPLKTNDFVHAKYDFDAWAQAHYNVILRKRREERFVKEYKEHLQATSEREEKNNLGNTVLTCICFVIVAVFLGLQSAITTNNDKVRAVPKSNKENLR